MIESICFVIGIIILLRYLIEGIKELYIIVNGSKCYKKYGKGSWAIISGASDGIGKGFCIELAKEGFKIVLIARNQ